MVTEVVMTVWIRLVQGSEKVKDQDVDEAHGKREGVYSIDRVLHVVLFMYMYQPILSLCGPSFYDLHCSVSIEVHPEPRTVYLFRNTLLWYIFIRHEAAQNKQQSKKHINRQYNNFNKKKEKSTETVIIKITKIKQFTA